MKRVCLCLGLAFTLSGCYVSQVITDIRVSKGRFLMRNCDLKQGFGNMVYVTACEWEMIDLDDPAGKRIPITAPRTALPDTPPID